MGNNWRVNEDKVKFTHPLVRYSYLSILPDNNVDIFAASPLVSYYHFSLLILSLIANSSFYILSKWLRQKFKRLSDARVVPMTKKENGFAMHFL